MICCKKGLPMHMKPETDSKLSNKNHQPETYRTKLLRSNNYSYYCPLDFLLWTRSCWKLNPISQNLFLQISRQKFSLQNCLPSGEFFKQKDKYLKWLTFHDVHDASNIAFFDDEAFRGIFDRVHAVHYLSNLCHVQIFHEVIVKDGGFDKVTWSVIK